MSNPQSGWYPDPSGEQGRLRYWDGTQWTNDYTDYPAGAQAQESTPDFETVSAAMDDAAQSEYVRAEVIGDNQSSGYQQTNSGYYQQTSASSQQANTGYYQQQNSYQQNAAGQYYLVDQRDQTLRLIAFILCIVSTVGSAIFVIPLAWCIPMTVRSYNIYKGKKPNTIAFGVCTLLFVNLISGILLLVSTKDV